REGFRSQREALSGSFDNACEPASAMSRRQLAQAFHEKRERYGNAPTADTRTSTACAGTAFITTLFPVEPMGDTSLESIRERSEEHTSELQSRFDIVCRLLLVKKKRTS